MLISLLILLLLSNALTLRKDKSILFSRIVMVSLVHTSYLAYNNLFFSALDKGIVIFGGLFHVTVFTQTFNIFIFILTAIILTLTSFYPRKVMLNEISSLSSILFSKFNYNKTKISNKMSGQFRILEYSLIIVLGIAILLSLIGLSKWKHLFFFSSNAAFIVILLIPKCRKKYSILNTIFGIMQKIFLEKNISIIVIIMLISIPSFIFRNALLNYLWTDDLLTLFYYYITLYPYGVFITRLTIWSITVKLDKNVTNSFNKDVIEQSIQYISLSNVLVYIAYLLTSRLIIINIIYLLDLKPFSKNFSFNPSSDEKNVFLLENLPQLERVHTFLCGLANHNKKYDFFHLGSNADYILCSILQQKNNIDHLISFKNVINLASFFDIKLEKSGFAYYEINFDPRSRESHLFIPYKDRVVIVPEHKKFVSNINENYIKYSTFNISPSSFLFGIYLDSASFHSRAIKLYNDRMSQFIIESISTHESFAIESIWLKSIIDFFNGNENNRWLYNIFRNRQILYYNNLNIKLFIDDKEDFYNKYALLATDYTNLWAIYNETLENSVYSHLELRAQEKLTNYLFNSPLVMVMLAKENCFSAKISERATDILNENILNVFVKERNSVKGLHDVLLNNNIAKYKKGLISDRHILNLFNVIVQNNRRHYMVSLKPGDTIDYFRWFKPGSDSVAHLAFFNPLWNKFHGSKVFFLKFILGCPFNSNISVESRPHFTNDSVLYKNFLQERSGKINLTQSKLMKNFNKWEDIQKAKNNLNNFKELPFSLN